jgi:cell wall-associated NlpC family hydrolase
MRRLLVLILAAAPVLAGPALGPADASPRLESAQAQATALRAEIDRLQMQAEQETEGYDAATSQLADVVAQRVAAEARLQAAQSASTSADGIAAARARALYESGGPAALLDGVLGGTDPNDILDRYRSMSAVFDSDALLARTADATTRRAAETAARLDQLASRAAALSGAAAAKAEAVQQTLARAQQLLATATAQVRQLAEADRQAAQAAAARAALASIAAARTAENQALRGMRQGGDPGTAPPAAPTAAAAAAIAAAETKLGDPYQWGATGPDSFDCSGLTQWSYAQAGIALPRTAAEQWYSGPHPSLGDLAPGDLLFWATDLTDPATIHHVAIYLGNGLMIAAPHTGTLVQIQPVYLDGYYGASRPTA